ncbi:E3 ubiquitin-protein ligase BRE1A-like [Paramacrobiotus metropolitanus]|uniref:E3 ubiquitin-protein ligase BRE1A-like n=1 Tax=Paramacrobiotus metropolitanus TaxID=2943436 RepID=UPI0024458FF0|nr:E3 ubiquitin-protein ligase BRE1A-like [Paramacrobiotus metropolitanus]XP_055354972.1 E3 ubiquitin-protein ligase BRE1A-like [Paramacrobiotus metropolitanus]XP_055354973.1 E3 ubiquitin-protein ligase BRE1A-like [Paramacrobiotus metropolitanus]XP_055354974.1 E3 ubiquitin-protein ligase BRE1A-like [Paramacrobiotus metropolitanus]XP_055354975.1 E3 ubiquitin-protein ligase BRE1A-like [Paramacrobiotus metropolitanus]XP_055354976.1 E3 ubiquitin-protein ligase BRE1A-like [Paramacrobiotus metropoli
MDKSPTSPATPSDDCSSRIARIDRLLSEQRAKLSAMGFLSESSSALEIPKSLLPTLQTKSLPVVAQSQSTLEFSTDNDEFITEEIKPAKSLAAVTYPSASLTVDDVLARVRSMPIGKLLAKRSDPPKDTDSKKSSVKNKPVLPKSVINPRRTQEKNRAADSRKKPVLPIVNPDDPLSYIDVTAKTLGSDAAVHILKAKVRAQHSDLEHAQEQIERSQQQLARKSSEQEELESEYRELKIRQTQQENKLLAAANEARLAKKKVQELTSELEAFRKELADRRRKKVDVKRNEVSAVSLNRLSVVQEKLNKELQELREANAVLSDMKDKQAKEIEAEKKSHRKQLEKFVKVLYKQEELVSNLELQQRTVEQRQLTAFSEDEFQRCLKMT